MTKLLVTVFLAAAFPQPLQQQRCGCAVQHHIFGVLINSRQVSQTCQAVKASQCKADLHDNRVVHDHGCQQLLGAMI